MEYTAIIEKISDECYIAGCAEIKGANTQGTSIEDAANNLSEAIGLVLETERALAIEQSQTLVSKPFLRKVAVISRSGQNFWNICRKMVAI